MERSEFEKAYLESVRLAVEWAVIARKAGLLELEDKIDDEKADQRDIFHYGMRFVTDGTDSSLLDELLSNIVNQEKDENAKLLKNIQKEAVLGIQYGAYYFGVITMLNSYVDNALAQAVLKNFEDDDRIF
jgi:flagellar motor component MotA